MNKYAQVIHSRDQQASSEALGRFAGVFRNGWLIAGVTLLVTALGTIRALTATPLYEASTVIQIRRPAALAGDFRADDPATTEMEVLRSRSVLARVVERLHLDVKLDPAPPVLARLLARVRPGDVAVASRPQVRVVRFDVPPVLLAQPFRLTVTGGGGFELASERLGIRADGTADVPAVWATHYGNVGILVAGSAAPPGTRFVLRRLTITQATEQLQRALVVTENAKQSNVIKVALQGADPALMNRILGAVVEEYTRQRGSERQGEADALLASYDRQIEASQAALRKLDGQYGSLLQRAGIGDPDAESQSLVQQSSALETQLAAAQQRRAELSTRVGDGHPAMEAIDRQIADATGALKRSAARRDALAVAARELAQVRRDKQALDERTLALFNQRSKLDAVIAAGRDDVRVLDQPETALDAVTPGVATMAILSGFGGAVLGLFASFIKNTVRQNKRARMAGQRATRFRLIAHDPMESPGTLESR
jgi:tyrosine-protein kinase Etk/Wzc